MTVTGSGTQADPYTYVDISVDDAYLLNGKYVKYNSTVNVNASADLYIVADPFDNLSVSSGSLSGTYRCNKGDSFTFKVYSRVGDEFDGTYTFYAVPYSDTSGPVVRMDYVEYDGTRYQYSIRFAGEINQESFNFRINYIDVLNNALNKPSNLHWESLSSRTINSTILREYSTYQSLSDGAIFIKKSPPYSEKGVYTYSACIGIAGHISGSSDVVSAAITVYVAVGPPTLTFTPAPSGYGTVSPTSVTAPYGTPITVNQDGRTITVGSTVVTATPASPTQEFTYYFPGWTLGTNLPEYMPSSDYGVQVRFERIINSYTITWKNYDGTVLATNTVNYGSTPSYSGPTPIKPYTASIAYTFSGWSPTVTTVTGPATYTAQFTESPRYYNVEVFVSPSEDYGSVNYTLIALPWGTRIAVDNNTVTFTYNNSQTYTPLVATPHDQTTEYVYAFGSWSGITSNTITDNMSITANFTRSTRLYTATFSIWPAGYGSVSPSNVSEPYGSSISKSGDKLTIGNTEITAIPAPQTAQYTYSFRSWTYSGTTLTYNMVVNVGFDRTLRTYDVLWMNSYDGSLLERDQDVPYGTTPEYNGPTPIHPQSVSEVYTFSGWRPTVIAVNGPATYKAQYTTSPRYYYVNFSVNSSDYGSVSSTRISVPYDTTISVIDNVVYFTYNGESQGSVTATPADPVPKYRYYFVSWSGITGDKVTGTMNIVANFNYRIREYTLTFTVRHGEGSVSPTSVTAPYETEVTASGNQILVGSTTVTATPKSPDAQYTYLFNRWDGVPPYVSGNREIYASFGAQTNKYTVTWKSQDGSSVLETDADVLYGSAPSYDSAAPTKTQTAQYSYTFAGWATSPNQESGTAVGNLPTVSGGTTYYAAFSKTVRTYNVYWKNYDNTTLETDRNVEYGMTPSYDGPTPVKPATAEYYYTFSGWSPDVSSVTGVATYTAQYTENEVTLYITDNGIVKVFDWKALEYVPINDAPFVLILQPNGGLFRYNTLKPSIKVDTCKRTNDDGATIQLAVPPMYDHYEPLYYTTLSDGTGAFIWAMTYDSCTEISLYIKDLPTVANSGLTAPPGFDRISAWEVHIPYTKFSFNSSETPMSTPFTMTMSRASTENFRHVSADPYWIPARDGALRCLTVTPGMGSLDFGKVQGISRTYNASLTTIPIVCYGYTGSFCIDLGVSEIVTLNYMRVGPDTPDNTSSDSRRWSNSFWIKKLKELTNRWQMRTNGSALYLKRPNLERLTNGVPQSSTSPPTDDPMLEYLSEIDGDNCYITSAPIKYDTANPHMIRSSVTFKIGTLYPKQPPYSMSKVTYTWPDHPERTRIVSYPSGITAVLPSLPLDWGAIYEGGVYSVAVGWKIGNVAYQPGDYFNTPSAGNTLTVNVDVESSTSVATQLITDSSKSYTVSGGRFIIAYAVGGGGGGGAAYMHVIDGQIYASAGGAGGASGGASSKQITYTNSATISVTIGSGGTKGTYNGSDSEGTDGTSGSATIVEVNSIQRVYARGGEGGKHATGNLNPGSYGLSTQSAVDGYVTEHAGSYPGGDGGISVDRAANNAANGSDGHSDTTYNMHGLGGTADNHNGQIGTTWTYYRMGGGGGGGGPTWPNSDTCTAYGGYAGSGQDLPSGKSVDGARGGGGGGGGGYLTDYLRPRDAGNGGDGFVYIVAPNGTITEN